MLVLNEGGSLTLKKIMYNQKIVPWLFIAPFMLFFLVFKVYPILTAAFYSFYEMQGFGLGNFVGLENYSELLTDSNFLKALLNNTKYMIGTMITLIPIPLVFAVMLKSKLAKGRNIYKAILFIPSLTSLVIAAAVFKIILYEGDYGLVNAFIGTFGIAPQKWLVNPNLTMISVIMIATWRWTGINMIYFATGLTNISNELYEAASIDGASVFQRFYHITVPLLKPVIIFVMTLNLIGGYKLFTEVFTLWAGGSSPGKSALTLAILLYRNAFSYFKLGYASTIGFVMALIILLLSLIQLNGFGFFNKNK